MTKTHAYNNNNDNNATEKHPLAEKVGAERCNFVPIKDKASPFSIQRLEPEQKSFILAPLSFILHLIINFL